MEVVVVRRGKVCVVRLGTADVRNRRIPRRRSWLIVGER